MTLAVNPRATSKQQRLRKEIDMTAPQGFVPVGRLQGSSASVGGAEFKGDVSLPIPIGARIDSSYQMTGSLLTSGGGATSSLQAGDIPPGFYIECGGSDTHGRRWAVLTPYHAARILNASVDMSGPVPKIGQMTFTLGIYADTGTGFEAGLAGGSTATADIYYKQAV